MRCFMVDAPPTQDTKDKAISVVTKILESLPYRIGTATSLAQVFFTTPFEKRQHQWFTHLFEVVAELQRDSITAEKLLNDDETMDVFIQATSIATKTIQRDKIEALKNAILHSAQGNAPEFALQQIFLNHVDRFTEWHIKILKFSSNPRQWFVERGMTPPDRGMGGIGLCLRTYLEAAYDELKLKKDIINVVVTELYNADLITVNKGVLDEVRTVNETLASKTTSLGEKLINFISK